MSRVAVIGDNSPEYISRVLDIWNDGDSVVLIDRQTPPGAAIKLMREAGVTKCYVDSRLYRYQAASSGEAEIAFIKYDTGETAVCDLPEAVRDKFHENYSREEAVVLYSSGTTGNSRGIILSHFAVNTNAGYIAGAMEVTAGDCIYVAKALSHSATFTGEMLVALHSGARLVLAPTILPPRAVLRNVIGCGATILCLNPSLLSLLAEEMGRDAYGLPKLRKVYVSGSVLTDVVYRKAGKAFGVARVYNMYGLSEAGPRVTMGSHGCAPCSVGYPVGEVEVAVLGQDGRDVPPGTRGLVHIKTPCLYSGYVSGTVKHTPLRSGWFHTGDTGYLDEAGALYITGRADEVINLNAHKIYPADVENRVMELGDVRECAVAAYRYGETVRLGCAYVSDRDIPDPIRRLKDRLLPYEIPGLFVRVDRLPGAMNGKVPRRLVADLLERNAQGRKMQEKEVQGYGDERDKGKTG